MTFYHTSDLFGQVQKVELSFAKSDNVNDLNSLFLLMHSTWNMKCSSVKIQPAWWRQLDKFGAA